jgi:uncharacterized membrane protein YGL010W
MRAATDLLSGYAEYHRDQRNILSHFLGVPMIVFAVGVMLAHPAFVFDGVALSPAWIFFAAAAAWYLSRGNLVLGVAVTAGVGVLMLAAHKMAYGGVGAFFGWGVCMFVVGWLIQFVGHWYEGKKPAFVDDLIGLLVGPMFVTAEAMFMMGWNKPLAAEIERRAGPTVLRDMAKIVA